MEELMIADELEFQHVLECVFDVQKHESRTYLALLDAPGSTVAELAEDLERDRSNVNRSLGTLVEKGLAERERRLLDAGGYVYQYTAVPLPEARERMHEAVEEWSAQVHERIDEFGSAR
ncbi:helix-turn-helix domain-containing protein [Halalkalicoccus ordinarius]|uniref:helix-turn-helix domain-containing protein n=1 Tax=Halalkalicoccus ordinarius TaxID=3116651 RepID=UPI0039082595